MAEVPVDLYRSCKTSRWKGDTEAKRSAIFLQTEGRSSLLPDYEGFIRRDGSLRVADVTTFTDRQGVVWVRGVEDRDDRGRPFVSRKEGVSVSTTKGGFGYEGWFYFLVPRETPIPASLDAMHTPSGNDQGHYSIRCRTLMRRDAYEGALRNLARAAIAKAVEQGRQSLYHS